MREILFRGRSKVQGSEWLYGDVLIYKNSAQIWETINNRKHNSVVSLETVGQYTGLTDKNGKKIFEGDIVKVERDLWRGENKKEREVFNGVVWYDEKHTCFGLKSEKYRCLPIWNFRGDYSTVVGNIHDNPELLKGGGDND